MNSDFVYGVHAIGAVLDRNPSRLIEAFTLKGRHHRLVPILNVLRGIEVPVKEVERRVLDGKVGGASHQGIVARLKPARVFNEQDLGAFLSKKKEPLIVILDGVTDPGNLGSCLRTADAAGVSAVIVPKKKSAFISSAAVVKVACGAAETVPLVRVTNLARTMKFLKKKGVWLVGTGNEAGNDIHQSKMTGPLAIVMGSEGRGIRRLTREICDNMVRIPTVGDMSSLNVSVATGVCLFEILRQKSTMAREGPPPHASHPMSRGMDNCR